MKKEIQEDEKRIEANLEKSILQNRFSEIISEIKRESFLKDVTSDVKNKVTNEFDSLLQNKLESAANHSDLVYNLSTIDMKKIVQLIDKVKDKKCVEL